MLLYYDYRMPAGAVQVCLLSIMKTQRCEFNVIHPSSFKSRYQAFLGTCLYLLSSLTVLKPPFAMFFIDHLGA